MPASDLYLRVREKEGRVYSDEVVMRLPEVPASHPLRREWAARRASMKRLLRYVRERPSLTRILELGCGNGWLSHHLACLPGKQVWGVDRKSAELTQATRVFGKRNVLFLATDIFEAPFAAATFDMVLIASAIQYFPDLPKLIHPLRRLLRQGGELHIMDSPFYEEADLRAARERSQAHYAALGFPEMTAYYFHHTYAELKEFSPRWLYRPHSLKGRLAGWLGLIDSPFPWLCIC